MKKILLIFMMIFCVAFGAVNAQDCVSCKVTEYGDAGSNWFASANVGTQMWNSVESWAPVSKPARYHSWIESQALIGNLTVGKYITPHAGIQVSGDAVFNAGSKTFVDAHNLALEGVLNVTNLICGTCNRLVGLNVYAGPGWFHEYSGSYETVSVNAGVNIDININKNLAVRITPAYMYLSEAKFAPKHNFALFAGVTYKFGNGRSGFTKKTVVDSECYDNLLEQYEALRAENVNMRNAVTTCTECAASKAVVTDVVMMSVDNTWSVLFDKGSYQVGNVQAIADALNQTDGKLVITGFTSPEGTEKFNANLAVKRAEALKNALVNVGVDSDRIIIENSYEDARVATVTLIK